MTAVPAIPAFSSWENHLNCPNELLNKVTFDSNISYWIPRIIFLSIMEIEMRGSREWISSRHPIIQCGSEGPSVTHVKLTCQDHFKQAQGSQRIVTYNTNTKYDQRRWATTYVAFIHSPMVSFPSPYYHQTHLKWISCRLFNRRGENPYLINCHQFWGQVLEKPRWSEGDHLTVCAPVCASIP